MIELFRRDADFFLRRSGSPPPVLLLASILSTYLMGWIMAPLLARHFTVIQLIAGLAAGATLPRR